EVAKRRLVYTLLELGLPLESKEDQPQTGLAFAFKQDGLDGQRVLTGHCDGLVTINIREADAPSREQTRVQLGERYRTLLGHFRHESGHYYWDRLVRDSAWLEDFRVLFGDEQADYAEAVKRHYATPKLDWADEYVTAYATMHPWEDWAETWAHYLHMVDTLETARSYGLALRPSPIGGATSEVVSARRVHFDHFEDLIAAWVPLTVALNSLNRSMGLPDLYPFVLAERVIAKLRFVHQVVDKASTGIAATLEAPPRHAERVPGPPLPVNPA
ncbi:MAG TPA: putative zinc-binding metallopeptidase, partial [Polyangiaceae bacterium]|nr:putative zinc-binding metallopeptidase [Polyangiaceae bacterium]